MIGPNQLQECHMSSCFIISQMGPRFGRCMSERAKREIVASLLLVDDVSRNERERI